MGVRLKSSTFVRSMAVKDREIIQRIILYFLPAEVKKKNKALNLDIRGRIYRTRMIRIEDTVAWWMDQEEGVAGVDRQTDGGVVCK